MSEILSFMLSVLVNLWFLIGMGCYALSIGLWLIVLVQARGQCSFPLLSIGYVITAVVGYFFLSENVGLLRVGGIALFARPRPDLAKRLRPAMRHVITGGSGFTGQALTTLLAARGAEVVTSILSRRVPPLQTSHFYSKRMSREVRALQQLAIGVRTDVVYHLAARQFGGGSQTGGDLWFAEVTSRGTEMS